MSIFGWMRDKKKEARDWVEKGDRAIKREVKYDCYDRATESDPENCGAWIRKGESLVTLDKHEEAIKAFDRASGLNPNDALPLNYKGLSLANLEKHNEAIAVFAKAIEINPNLSEIWFNKGISLGTLGKYEEAFEAYNKALEINSNYAMAWTMKGMHLANYCGKYEEAIKAFDRAIELDPDYGVWESKGSALAHLGRHEEAIKAYDMGITLVPQIIISLSWELWNRKGQSLAKLERYDEAIRSYNRSIQLSPSSSVPWINKGISLAALGKYEEAIQAYDRATELNPKSGWAWNNKGMSLVHLSRHEEAIKAYDKATQINPNYVHAWNNKGFSLAKLGKYEEAIKVFNRATEIDPKLPQTWSEEGSVFARSWSGKGNVFFNLNNYGEAIESYNSAIEMDSDFFEPWFGLGNVFVKLGKLDEALKAYDRAVKLNPECGQGWYNRATVLYDLGRYDESLSAYKRAISIFPDDLALQETEEEIRTMLFRSLFKLNIGFSEAGLKHNIWKLCPVTVANTGNKQLIDVILSFSGDIECRLVKPFSLLPSEQKSFDCTLKALARGSVPIEVTVTARDSDGEKYSTTYSYSIQITDPQISLSPTPLSEAKGGLVQSPARLSLDRTIYDPVLQDFLVSSERALINVRTWIEDHDPASYWCVICVHNDSDSPIDEWGIELDSASSLKVIDTYIEGHEENATVRESHPMPWLSQWILGVPHHAGIVIPRNGSRRIYIKLGSDVCGANHSLQGRFISSTGVELPIRRKTFTHSCDVATLRTALSSDPAAAEQYAENIIRREYDRDTALKLLRSFKLVQEIDQCCTLQKYEDILDRMQLLAGTLEGIQAGEKLTHLVQQSCDALTILGDGEASVERARRLCGSIVDTWVNEFI